MYRHVSFLIIAICLGLAATLGTASAQSVATGTLVGHLSWCKGLQRPVGEMDGEPSPLADVTPGRGRPITAPVRIPASDVQVSLLGTGLSVMTDATGGFMLSGVPAAQALTLVASVPSGPPLLLNGPNLVVAAGQTRDLGSVGLAGCGDSGAVLTVAPAPDADTTMPPDTDPATEPADPSMMTDGSN